MKDLFNSLNKANRLMNTANNTAHNVSRTKNTIDRIGNSGKQSAQQKAAAKAQDWKCECGKKNSSKFCENCGKSKPACPKCGTAATGAKFCAECGTRMTDA
jgi:membrane protease subunit (stomatin/prohibitin family)